MKSTAVEKLGEEEIEAEMLEEVTRDFDMINLAYLEGSSMMTEDSIEGIVPGGSSTLSGRP